MSLKPNVFYDTKSDKLFGLEDIGTERISVMATSALVVMARRVFSMWKQPIAFFFVNNSCDSLTLQRIIASAIGYIEKIGLNVLGIVSDMGSNFLKLASLLGACEKRPYFILNENQYFYMFDVPHLLKATRNNLLKHDIGFVSKGKSFIARWKYLEKVFEKDSSFKFRCVPKLTPKHINPSNFNKMKVKCATQVLRHSVAAALCTHLSFEALPQDTEETAEFISIFNDLFDCLNSSTFSTPVFLRKPITPDSTHLTYVQEVLSVIDSIRFFEPEKGQKIKFKIKYIQGWKTTINSVIQLWKKLIENFR